MIADAMIDNEHNPLYSIMTSDRQLVLRSTSPDGQWELTVQGPTPTSQSFYAVFSRRGDGINAFPFGYPTDEKNVVVRWDLPDQTCGIFIGKDCFALFRYGARRRRRREYCRTGEINPFGEEEIAWICAKKHSQHAGPNRRRI
jgi:hypothetical protein